MATATSPVELSLSRTLTCSVLSDSNSKQEQKGRAIAAAVVLYNDEYG